MSHISGTIFHLVKSDFRSNESFPVKTGSCPTEMVDPSFDAEYPNYQGLVEVSDQKRSTSGFIGEKPVKNRKLTKMGLSMLKRKAIVDFLIKI